jgi:hypothetical protein
MKTNDLINLLANDLRPRWSFRSAFIFATVGGILIAAVVFLLRIGFRPDLSQALESVRFLFKFVVTLALAIGATGAALRVGSPGRGIEHWAWGLGAAPALLACAVVVEMIAVPEGTWMTRLVGHNARFCLTLIPLLSIGPLAFLLIALRQGAPTRPGLAGAFAGLAASGIAATFYASNCTDDSPLFVATWYPMAALMVAATGYLAGRKLLTW